MVLFWGHLVTNPISKTCLSQWYPASFEVEGVHYVNAEQFMMASKARHFQGNEDILHEIMCHTEPKVIKALGRQVRNFKSDVWDRVCKTYVYIGNRAKFSQNLELKEFLLSTGDQIIAEASPFDRIWGIGLNSFDSRAQHPNQWLGKNYLGEVLMRVRKDLQEK